ncbi:MAG: hypothetical protein ABIQ16_12790 [Polyangiaceae bacterium]
MSLRSGRAPDRYPLDALPQPPNKVRVLEAERVSSGRARAGLRSGGQALEHGLAVFLLLLFGVRPAAAEPPSATPAPAPASAQPKTAPVPLLAFVFGAIGLSGVSVGGTTGFLALNQKAIAEDHCSPMVQLCDARGRAANETGRTLRDISTAGFIVGGIGLGLSAYFLLTAPAQNGDVAVAVVVDGARPQAALVAHF